MQEKTRGPFPHPAPPAAIGPENPAGTDGFAFVEFAHPEPAKLRELFAMMGYALTARHRTRAIELWQQGDITYILNDDPGSHARAFVEEHGPCAPSMGWRMVDPARALAHAVSKG
ncbi:MAG TPA: 4-hydroxyphenylpyruvate dioxygenase, partial [Paracoccaceae bacterium]|nr:4-hydroxyphenylpyruvate dioxygenase [Paracoccaceae bacterium]